MTSTGIEDIRQAAWRAEVAPCTSLSISCSVHHLSLDSKLAPNHLQIPLKLTLATNDNVTPQQPRPVLALVPRFGYLPFVAEQIKPLFQHLLPPGEDTPWFEYQGQPLQWQHPAGVLYDLHVLGQQRPWCLTVHYRACPVQSILSWSSQLAQATFLNTLKEAAIICTGSANRVMNMTSFAQQDLQEAIRACDFKKLSGISEQLGFGATAPGMRLPVRVVIAAGGACEVITLPMTEADLEEQPVSLLRALHQIMPQRIPESTDHSLPTSVQVIVAGTQPSPSLPLSWLHACLGAADNFLYLVVRF